MKGTTERQIKDFRVYFPSSSVITLPKWLPDE